MLLALSESWSDLVAIGGLILTASGFAITIAQLRKTKSAADAAREAAERASSESRQQFQNLVSSNAHTFISQVRESVDRKDWSGAARRVNDLADQMALVPQQDIEFAQLINDLRAWGSRFSRLASGDLKKFYNSRWENFFLLLQQRIDSLRAPFASLGAE